MSKGPEAFRTISEAAESLGVPAHVLRFWETKFSFIRPMKLAGGRRFYRPRDVAVLAGVRRLLHDQGYTIKGVQKLYREHGVAAIAKAEMEGDLPSPNADPADLSSAGRERLRLALTQLEAARAKLGKVS